jgi:spermidine synthase
VSALLAVAFLALHVLSLESADAARAASSPPAGAPLGKLRLRLLGAAVAVSGFVAFSYEVLWTRLLAFKFEATVYAFSTMLATFLLGLGLGGAAIGASRRMHARADWWRVFGWLQAVIALSGLLSAYLLLLPRFPHSSFAGRTLAHLGTSAIVMIVPAVCMGAAFPIACHLFAGGTGDTGRSVGSIYVLNTVGSVCGALLTGFVFVTVIGTQGSLILASMLMAVSAVVVLGTGAGSARWSRATAPVAVCVVMVAAVISMPRGMLRRYYLRSMAAMFGNPELEIELLGYDEGVEGTTLAVRMPNGDRLLSSGVHVVAGSGFELRKWQKLLAHVPMLLHPDPQAVCQVGFGSGETASVFRSYGPERYECVEISRGVFEIARAEFSDINDGIGTQDGFEPVIMDAAAYLRWGNGKYDIIANDASWPHLPGSSVLYTRDYFESGRARLRPGGLFTSWMPLDMPPEDFRSVLKTFTTVFPHASVWIPITPENSSALLIGSLAPLRVDGELFADRFRAHAQAGLAEVMLGDPITLLSCHLATADGMAADLSEAPLHTEDHPILLFLESRPEEFQADRQKRQASASLRFLARHRGYISPRVVATGGGSTSGMLEALRRAERATDFLLDALLASGSYVARRDSLEQVARLMPEHPFLLLEASELAVLSAIDNARLPRISGQELSRAARKFLEAGLPQQALRFLAELRRRSPESAAVLADLGACYLEMGEPEEAARCLQEALRISPDLAEARLNLGLSYLQSGDAEAAVAALEEAAALAPEEPVLLDSLATACLLTGRQERAEQLLRRCAALDADYLPARYNLAVLLYRTGRPAEAIPHMEAYASGVPDPAEVAEQLAELYEQAGRPEDARRIRTGARGATD